MILIISVKNLKDIIIKGWVFRKSFKEKEDLSYIEKRGREVMRGRFGRKNRVVEGMGVSWERFLNSRVENVEFVIRFKRLILFCR